MPLGMKEREEGKAIVGDKQCHWRAAARGADMQRCRGADFIGWTEEAAELACRKMTQGGRFLYMDSYESSSARLCTSTTSGHFSRHPQCHLRATISKQLPERATISTHQPSKSSHFSAVRHLVSSNSIDSCPVILNIVSPPYLCIEKLVIHASGTRTGYQWRLAHIHNNLAHHSS